MTDADYVSLYEQHYQRMVTQATYLLGAAEAEDAAQDAACNLWQHRDRYTVADSGWALLATIVHHECIDRLRSRNRRKTCRLADIHPALSPPWEDVWDTQQALSRLKPRQRSVLARRVRGERLSGTDRVYLLHARERLRALT